MTFQQFMDTYGPVRDNQYLDRPTSDDQVTISWVENGSTIKMEIPKSWNNALRSFIQSGIQKEYTKYKDSLFNLIQSAEESGLSYLTHCVVMHPFDNAKLVSESKFSGLAPHLNFFEPINLFMGWEIKLNPLCPIGKIYTETK